MTDEEFVALVRRHQGGVLLDTNVLLLYVMAATDISAARSWKQTRQFTDIHIDYLSACLQNARRVVLTPHILAEATNLSVGIPERLRTRYWQVLRSYIEQSKERSVSARDAARDEDFSRLGLADVAQALLKRARPLVVTVDAGLFALLSKRGHPVVNLNHYAFPLSD